MDVLSREESPVRLSRSPDLTGHAEVNPDPSTRAYRWVFPALSGKAACASMYPFGVARWDWWAHRQLDPLARESFWSPITEQLCATSQSRSDEDVGRRLGEKTC